MKSRIILSLITVSVLLTGGSSTPAHSQDPTSPVAPTFYHLVPGTYVNEWPRFTLTYPKDWVERPLNIIGGEVFRVSPPGPYPSSSSLGVSIGAWPFPIEKWADSLVSIFKSMGMTDVTIVSDKPSELRDGIPAREVEVKMRANGIPVTRASLATRSHDVQVAVGVSSSSGKIGEDLKAILYSLEFDPSKDMPVQVPPDVREFLDRFCSDVVSRDVDKVVSHYSDRFLHAANRKGQVELNWRLVIGQATSCEVVLTDFVPAEDRAYVAGFVSFNFQKGPLNATSIIKENGEWKFYGNQRDVAP
jgi:hypothetical protein